MRIDRRILLVCILIAVGLLLYGGVLNTGFVSDDWDWIYLAAHSSSFFPDFFANYEGTHFGGSYNPIVSLYIQAIYSIFGAWPLPYHIGSVALHIANAFLVFILISIASKDSKNSQEKKYTRSVAGAFLFLLWPTLVEPVAWIASVPHILFSFWSLLSLIFFFKYIRTQSFSSALAVCSFFILALLSKEVAIILPIIFIAIFAFNRQAPKKKAAGILGAIIGIAIAYLFVRFGATGLLLGSYAESSFVLRIEAWVNTILVFFIEFFTAGFGRQIFMDAFWNNTVAVAVGTSVGLLVVIIFILKKSKTAIFPFILFVLSILPYIPLGFNRLSDEGERYTYFPAIFFVWFITMLIHGRYQVTRVFIAAVLLVFSFTIQVKTGKWISASIVAEEIKSELHEKIEHADASELLVIGLPDTLSGAHVYRNGLARSYELSYENTGENIVVIPIYTQYRVRDMQPILIVESDDRGYFIRSSMPLGITGFDRRELVWFTYELWGYNYDTFSTDTIRLLLSDDQRELLADAAIDIIVWNGDQFVFLDDKP